jgi:hypothetical protein
MDIFYPGSIHNMSVVRDGRVRSQSRRSSNFALSTVSLAMPAAGGPKASWKDDVIHVLKVPNFFVSLIHFHLRAMKNSLNVRF